eukprot:Protomagalhaensia_sp_Gyna_25__3676@NODE_32_length_7245_cov_75_898973_g22_i0_p2_GENE_NODE_32_length_7245_cov_75_898973_g22_i0NODE_32_length_7245_cov_75_898973_g22_i0_p2_ORF_typecomplete_len525_score83_15DcuA_DcuB/PF03605_14/1_5e72DcuA_DcuB/PF03605_14/3_4e39MatC_N/PF07158_11/2_2e06MatC_N/PF07158_11/6_9e02CitMHS/PF03600_16/0_11CitMHS/PF03600_16/1_8e04_NODE_32_length_7245_cov_75_898973_g22_i0741648
MASAVVRGVLCAIQFIFFLAAIALGSWVGGVGIGMAGGLGVLILTLFFQLPVGNVPFEVLAIIVCVICAISSMQCAGGMDWLVSMAERVMRKNPRYITIVGPLVTLCMVVLAGTGHASYSVLPVIAEVSKVAGIRPSRPLTLSTTSSLLGIVTSPISAAVLLIDRLLDPPANSGLQAPGTRISYVKILGIMLPGVILGTFVSSIIIIFWGKELADDPHYADRWERGLTTGGPIPTKFKGTDLENQRLAEKLEANAEHADSVEVNAALIQKTSNESAASLIVEEEPKPEPVEEEKKKKVEYPKGLFGWPAERVSLGIFFGGLLFVVLYSILISDAVGLVSADNPVKLDRAGAILCGMLTTALLICIFCKCEPAKVTQQLTFRSGMTAVICVLGVAWMGDTFVSYYAEDIGRIAGDVLRNQGWLLAVINIVAAPLLYSQIAVVSALYPTAISIGVSSIVLIGCFPGAASQFILPTGPVALTCVALDETGTTRIGKYVFDHSFIVPGLLHIILSIVFCFLFALMIVH